MDNGNSRTVPRLFFVSLFSFIRLQRVIEIRRCLFNTLESNLKYEFIDTSE